MILKQIQETKKVFESTEIFLLKETAAALSDPGQYGAFYGLMCLTKQSTVVSRI